jgi:hypothetical protein
MPGAKYLSPLAMLLSRGGGKSQAKPGSMKKGGRVRKGGVAKLHKGEQVVSRKRHRGHRSKKR